MVFWTDEQDAKDKIPAYDGWRTKTMKKITKWRASQFVFHDYWSHHIKHDAACMGHITGVQNLAEKRIILLQ
jgi:hypothetical protein